ncbi:NAD-binding protein [Mycena sanguinolenta]|nr:NAD-binding protein [Mycena sanguinolenta]
MSSKGVVLVTGAAQGIGRSIALRLADDGFDVAVNDISKNSEKLDALMVANAGVAGNGSPLTEVSTEEWDRVMNINARGTCLCYKYAGIQMIKQGRGGRIIGPRQLPESRGLRSKDLTALLNSQCVESLRVQVGCPVVDETVELTSTSALEFGPHGITVNAYAPGVIDTPIFGATRNMIFEHFTELSVLKKTGVPEDISAPFLFWRRRRHSSLQDKPWAVCNKQFAH